MDPVIPLPLAFGFCSICFGGILLLKFLVAVVRRTPNAVDADDDWLIFFYSTLLTVAALMVLALSIFG